MSLSSWLGPVFLGAVALVMLLARRPLATFQANVLGGSVMSGCVIAEALLLVVVAAVMLLLR